MNDPGRNEFPAEFEAVVSRLRAERAQADPVQLDQIKTRVIARARKPQLTGGPMKSRLATLCTLVALVGGTGGAIAVADSGGGGNGQGSAATGQYRPGKGCGDKNHQHTGSQGKDPQKCPHHDQGSGDQGNGNGGGGNGGGNGNGNGNGKH